MDWLSIRPKEEIGILFYNNLGILVKEKYLIVSEGAKQSNVNMNRLKDGFYYGKIIS
mgnify:CR=1 FL=1